MRIWLGFLKKSDYLLAMERSPVKDVEIKSLLEPALTNRADDASLYFKGIDVSWLYEGYSEFRTEDFRLASLFLISKC